MRIIIARTRLELSSKINNTLIGATVWRSSVHFVGLVLANVSREVATSRHSVDTSDVAQDRRARNLNETCPMLPLSLRLPALLLLTRRSVVRVVLVLRVHA